MANAFKAGFQRMVHRVCPRPVGSIPIRKHLGGFEAEDGVFRYKLAFAPYGRRPFSVGFRIHDDLRYEELVDSKAASNERWQPAEGYFSVYRG